MPPTTAKEKAFIKYSSRASLNYFANEWSSLEETTWAILEKLGANEYIHNCLFPSPKDSYYKLDFFNPLQQKHISVDGIFHKAITHQSLRDREKDSYLASYGIETLHLVSEDFKDWKRLKEKIRRFIGS